LTDETQVAQDDEAIETVEQETPDEIQAEEPQGAEDQEGEGTRPDDEAAATDAEPEEVSESQKRRERRKAKMTELYTAAEEAKARMERQKAIWQGGDEPQEANYEDLTEFAIDKALWRDRQRQQDQQVKQVDEEIQAITEAQKAENAQYWQEQLTEARSRYTDFESVALGNHWNPTEAMTEAITTSDMGADVAYFLGSNAHIASRIAQLPPAQQMREIGKIEATISAPKPKTQSAAPAPITPVKSSTSPRKGFQGLSHDEYRRARMKEMNNG
jgi:hypothetical protein